MFDAINANGGVDFIEAGAGPLAVLVHSSMAGARQWSAMTRELQQRFRVKAINLGGYGGTPAWSGARSPSLDDFAELVAQAVPDAERNITLVGHSIGGAVAIAAPHHQRRCIGQLPSHTPVMAAARTERPARNRQMC